MKFYYLILGTLCVWRITHLLNAEDGPWDIVVRLRQRAGETFWGKLLDCFYCLSVWIGLPFAIYMGESIGEKFVLWLALSAGAILLERITNRTFDVMSTPYFEPEENNHVMLRKEKTTALRNIPDSAGS